MGLDLTAARPVSRGAGALRRFTDLIQGPEEALFRGYVLDSSWPLGSAGQSASVSRAFSAARAEPGLACCPRSTSPLFGRHGAVARWDQDQLWGVFAIHTVWNWPSKSSSACPIAATSPFGDVLFSVAPNPPYQTS